MRKTLKMRTKILISCLGCILFALVIQTVLFQNTSSKLIYMQAEQESFNSLQNMQNDIYSFIKRIESGLIDIYNEKAKQEKSVSMNMRLQMSAQFLANW